MIRRLGNLVVFPVRGDGLSRWLKDPSLCFEPVVNSMVNCTDVGHGERRISARAVWTACTFQGLVLTITATITAAVTAATATAITATANTTANTNTATTSNTNTTGTTSTNNNKAPSY
jgi:hypothetical protein